MLLSWAAVVQCDEYSFLRDLSALDVKKVIDGTFTVNHGDLDFVSRQRVADVDGTYNREYDWNKCVADLGSIGDGLNRTEMWAMQGKYDKRSPSAYKEIVRSPKRKSESSCKFSIIQNFCTEFFFELIVVDSWGKIPSGVLQGNLYGLGSFSECLNIQRNNEKYQSQYCLATITTNLKELLAPTPKPETRMFTPM